MSSNLIQPTNSCHREPVLIVVSALPLAMADRLPQRRLQQINKQQQHSKKRSLFSLVARKVKLRRSDDDDASIHAAKRKLVGFEDRRRGMGIIHS